jgi:hypothetical protein
MAVKELGPLFQFASWNIPQFPRAIEYPLEVLEEIRAFACDELLQLSHGGNEVGGILFGTRREDLVRILTWRPIACEHTHGEGLLLSYNDRINLAVQLELARQTADLKDLVPLGLVVSHLRQGVALSATDVEIYNGFFPEPWQVALVIHPKGGGLAEAGFFMREGEGKLRSESSYHTFELRPLQVQAEAASESPAPREPETPAKPETRAEPETAPPLESAPKPWNPATPESPSAWPAMAKSAAAPASLAVREVDEPPQPPRPARRSEYVRPAPAARDTSYPQLPTPSFEIEESLPSRERWLWAIPILLALGIAAFVLYQRRAPSPSSVLALRAWNESQTVQLAWDANSRAVRDAYRGEIAIDDGGKTSQVALTSDQVHAGKMSYLPQSSDVGFEITVYPTNGDPIHDSTRLIAPGFRAPTEAPQILPQNPPPPSASPAPVVPAPAAVAPATPVPSDANARDREVQQLRQEVAKQRARADELQNLVRILETRLGIQPTPSASGPRR